MTPPHGLQTQTTKHCRASVRVGRALRTVIIVRRASIGRVGQTIERLGSSSMSRQEFRWRSVAQLSRGVGFDSRLAPMMRSAGCSSALARSV